MRKLTILLLCVSSIAFAKESASMNKNVKGQVTPFVAHENGTYKFTDGTDNGNFSSVGAGLRAGAYWYFLYLGGETFVSTPRLTGGKDLPTATRDNYFLAQDYTVNYGATAAIRLGAIRLVGTLYIDSQLHGTMKNTNSALPGGHYTYYGTGSRVMVEFNLIKGLVLGAGYSGYTYDKYSLNRTLNTVDEADRAERTPLKLNSTAITINYEIPFGG